MTGIKKVELEDYPKEGWFGVIKNGMLEMWERSSFSNRVQW